jgi:hypothetical protein
MYAPLLNRVRALAVEGQIHSKYRYMSDADLVDIIESHPVLNKWAEHKWQDAIASSSDAEEEDEEEEEEEEEEEKEEIEKDEGDEGEQDDEPPEDAQGEKEDLPVCLPDKWADIVRHWQKKTRAKRKQAQASWATADEETKESWLRRMRVHDAIASSSDAEEEDELEEEEEKEEEEKDVGDEGDSKENKEEEEEKEDEGPCTPQRAIRVTKTVDGEPVDEFSENEVDKAQRLLDLEVARHGGLNFLKAQQDRLLELTRPVMADEQAPRESNMQRKKKLRAVDEFSESEVDKAQRLLDLEVARHGGLNFLKAQQDRLLELTRPVMADEQAPRESNKQRKKKLRAEKKVAAEGSIPEAAPSNAALKRPATSAGDDGIQEEEEDEEEREDAEEQEDEEEDEKEGKEDEDEDGHEEEQPTGGKRKKEALDEILHAPRRGERGGRKKRKKEALDEIAYAPRRGERRGRKKRKKEALDEIAYAPREMCYEDQCEWVLRRMLQP